MEIKNFDINEREKKILELIKVKGKVRVVDLSRIFGVSGVTIRSDLARLEDLNCLERVHGGAIQLSKQYDNMNYFERMSLRKAEKIQIGREVSKYINDGDTIAINAGTTSYLVAQELLNKKNLKIITNSIPIATELNNQENIEIVLLGGTINSHYSFTFGPDAIRQLERYRMNKSIISVDGVHMDSGITSYHQEEIELSSKMMKLSQIRMVIADYSKIGRESFAKISNITEIDKLFTNSNADKSIISRIDKKGVEVICATSKLLE